MDNKEKDFMKEEYMPIAPLSQLRKITNKLESFSDDAAISLEFVLVSLFPTAWDNIKAYGKDCYTQGYLAGLKEGKNENKGDN